jgi:hypothetical protein
MSGWMCWVFSLRGGNELLLVQGELCRSLDGCGCWMLILRRGRELRWGG